VGYERWGSAGRVRRPAAVARAPTTWLQERQIRKPADGYELREWFCLGR